MMRRCVYGLAILVLFASAVAGAQTKGVVTFGSLKNLEFINNFYNGGTGSLGSGPGPNFGLQFSTNAQSIISANKGGSGNFSGNPGGYPVMFFQTGKNVTMTAATGIQNGLYFYYSALQAGSATVYSGPNATGSILANIALTPNNSGCNTYKLCVWSVVGVPLSTPAGSISFAGVADYLAIGTLHLGSALPTKMTLVSSLNPSLQGEPVTFTATVTATGAAAAGNVTFIATNTVVGVVPLVGGTASITLSSLKTGTTHISAKFQGTGFVNAAKSLLQVVD